MYEIAGIDAVVRELVGLTQACGWTRIPRNPQSLGCGSVRTGGRVGRVWPDGKGKAGVAHAAGCSVRAAPYPIEHVFA